MVTAETAPSLYGSKTCSEVNFTLLSPLPIVALSVFTTSLLLLSAKSVIFIGMALSFEGRVVLVTGAGGGILARERNDVS